MYWYMFWNINKEREPGGMMSKCSTILALLIMFTIMVAISSCNSTTEPDKNQVATPTFNPPGGEYSSGTVISISCTTPGASIFYSVDGSAPTIAYTEPITVSSTCTLKAVATRLEWDDSSVASASYIMNTPPMPENFVLVAGGTFNNSISNVTISSFYIDKYEVTQAGYEAVMGNNPSSGYGVGNTYPVYFVSWFDAIEYCNRRSIQEGLTPCYSYSSYGAIPDDWPLHWNSDDDNHTDVSCNWAATGYRLPTEMEWMFAARGGKQTNNYTYSGSNDLNAVGWYHDNWGETNHSTHTIGAKLPNEIGIYDMSGNVQEWCWDIFGGYPSNAQTNPHGATSGPYRVPRGGGWNGYVTSCTVSYRIDFYPTLSFYNIGFRVCRIAP